MIDFDMVEVGVYSCSNVLSVNDFGCLADEMYQPHVEFKKESTVGAHSSHWIGLRKANFDGLGDSFFLISLGERLKYSVMKRLNRNLSLDRVNTNIQLKLHDTAFHTDGGNNMWTFLVFFSEYWDAQWGGDFIVNYAPKKYRGIPYIPNDGVLFNAAMPHRGCAGNIVCEGIRMSVAFTYVEL